MTQEPLSEIYYPHSGNWRYDLPCTEELQALKLTAHETLSPFLSLCMNESLEILRNKYSTVPPKLEPLSMELLRVTEIMSVGDYESVALELSFPDSFVEPPFPWRPKPWSSSPQHFNESQALDYLRMKWRELGFGKDDTNEEWISGERSFIEYEMRELETRIHRLNEDSRSSATGRNLYLTAIYSVEQVADRLRELNLSFDWEVNVFFSLVAGMHLEPLSDCGHFLSLEDWARVSERAQERFEERPEVLEYWGDALVTYVSPSGDLLAYKNNEFAWVVMTERRIENPGQSLESIVKSLSALISKRVVFHAYED